MVLANLIAPLCPDGVTWHGVGARFRVFHDNPLSPAEANYLGVRV
jgi:hypothetical protein